MKLVISLTLMKPWSSVWSRIHRMVTCLDLLYFYFIGTFTQTKLSLRLPWIRFHTQVFSGWTTASPLSTHPVSFQRRKLRRLTMLSWSKLDSQKLKGILLHPLGFPRHTSVCWNIPPSWTPCWGPSSLWPTLRLCRQGWEKLVISDKQWRLPSLSKL
jgi:hypothetical protein